MASKDQSPAHVWPGLARHLALQDIEHSLPYPIVKERADLGYHTCQLIGICLTTGSPACLRLTLQLQSLVAAMKAYRAQLLVEPMLISVYIFNGSTHKSQPVAYKLSL